MMDAFLNKYYFLKSRKFWAFAGGVATILGTAAGQDPYPITAVIQALVALVLGYIGSVAWEDTAAKNGAAMVDAAQITAATVAATTTVTTPGTSDVSVTTSDAPAPTVQVDGLR